MTPAIDRSKGSPPRMRGKDGVNDSAQAVTGITPACAGKSSAARRARQPSRDHPRVCGEKTEYRALVTAHQGSPPRMRGKVDLSLKVVRVLGITPACAGKSCPFLRRTSPRRDHPRVCGEKGQAPEDFKAYKGSPPRMRGKGIVHVLVPEPLGITPAYAGKRSGVCLS